MNEPRYRFYDCFQNLVIHDSEVGQSNEPETAAASVFESFEDPPNLEASSLIPCLDGIGLQKSRCLKTG